MSSETIHSRHLVPVAGCMVLCATSLILCTHHFGWFLRDINNSLVFPLVLCCIIMPVAAIIVANVNARARRVIFVITFLLFEVSTWGALLVIPNAMTPQFLVMDPLMAFLAHLPAGTSAVLFMISVAWVAGCARTARGWQWLIGSCFAAVGLLVAALLPIGVHGWLMLLLPAALLVPVAVMLRFGLASRTIEDRGASMVKPPALKDTLIVDSTKGLKLALFSIACVACMAVCTGLPVMGMPPVDLVTTNALLFVGFVAGAPLAAMIVFLSTRSLQRMAAGPARDKQAQVFFLVAVASVVGMNLPVFVADVQVPGLHGSAFMHVLLGVLLAMDMVFFTSVIIVFHPPRSFIAFIMFMAFLVFLALVVAGVFKAMPISGDIIEGIGEYAIIIAGVVVTISLPCTVAIVVTWFKKGRGGVHA